jgi:sRNA-binding carbon storage regulator CsrA
VVVNCEIIVTVVDICDDEVVLAVDAPDWAEVFPEEAVGGAETMKRVGISQRSS